MNTETVYIDPFYEDGIAKRTVAIQKAKDKFEELNNFTKLVDWSTEESLALQAINGNSYIQNIAEKHPASLYRAMINVASVGLTLNPAHAYAYLVPRDNKICLDISYKGLIKIATDTGAVRWVQCKTVRQNDIFKPQTVGQAPIHEYGGDNAFTGDRGDIVGFYCVAKTSDGDFLVETMKKAEIDEIMMRSQAWKAVGNPNSAAKTSPWHTDYEEMAKKTVIKRAAKLWPRTERGDRLHEAIDVLNEHEGINFEEEPPKEEVMVISEEEQINLQAAIEGTGIDIARILKYFKVNSLDCLPVERLSEAHELVESLGRAQ